MKTKELPLGKDDEVKDEKHDVSLHRKWIHCEILNFTSPLPLPLYRHHQLVESRESILKSRGQFYESLNPNDAKF